jgi:hypothetical protein
VTVEISPDGSLLRMTIRAHPDRSAGSAFAEADAPARQDHPTTTAWCYAAACRAVLVGHHQMLAV